MELKSRQIKNPDVTIYDIGNELMRIIVTEKGVECSGFTVNPKKEQQYELDILDLDNQTIYTVYAEKNENVWNVEIN